MIITATIIFLLKLAGVKQPAGLMRMLRHKLLAQKHF